VLHIWTDSTYPAYLEAGQQKSKCKIIEISSAYKTCDHVTPGLKRHKINDNRNILSIPSHHFGSSHLTEEGFIVPLPQ